MDAGFGPAMVQGMDKRDSDMTPAPETGDDTHDVAGMTTSAQQPAVDPRPSPASPSTATGAPNDAAAAARPSEGVALLLAVAMIAGAAVLRLVVYNDRLLPFGFGVPLVLFGWLRSRRYLWLTAVAFIAITFVKFLNVLPRHPGHVRLTTTEQVVDTALVTADVLLVALIIHMLIGAREWLVWRNAELAAANRDLAAREEEIARGNEALQAQAGQLERQSEALRVTNEDLAARERTLA